MDYEFSFTGPYKTNGQYQDEETPFTLYAVSTKGTSTIAHPLDKSSGIHPIRPHERGNWRLDEFVAEIYLVSANPLGNYKLNSNYYLTGGILGNFQVGMTGSANEYRTDDPILPVNGEPSGANTPILSPGIDLENNPIGYGEPSQQFPTALLTIKEVRAISLLDAIEDLTTEVAEAEIQMLNCLTGEEYAVDVVFTNLANTDPFRLVLQNGGAIPHTIPYCLHFNDAPVTPGLPICWDCLTNIPQSKKIFVTSVPPSAAEQALAGNYQDTVVVTIIPIDTI